VARLKEEADEWEGDMQQKVQLIDFATGGETAGKVN
jgi:hypothetical protein